MMPAYRLAALIILALSSVAHAEPTSTLEVTVTVAEPDMWIDTDAASEATITIEDAMAYCAWRGEEMHECRVAPDDVQAWKEGDR